MKETGRHSERLIQQPLSVVAGGHGRDAPPQPVMATVISLHEALFTAAPDAILIIATDGTIVDFNQATQRLFGYTREDLIGYNAELLASSSGQAGRGQSLIQKLLENHSSNPNKTYRVKGRYRDGTLFPALLAINEYTDYDPQTAAARRRFVCRVHDTSEPVRLRAFYRALAAVGEAGRQIHSEAAFLQEVVEQIASELRLPIVSAMRYDGAAQLTLRNAAGSCGERLKKDMPQQWPLCPLTRSALREGHLQICTDQDAIAQHGNLHYLFSRYQLRAMAAIPIYRQSRPWGVLLVSARESEYFGPMEHELLSRLADLTGRQLDEYDAHRALAEARQSAERANLAKSEFLTRMSHELRTPMNAIMGFAQVLQSQLKQAPHNEYVQQVLKAGHHLLELINEALSISRIESGRLALTIDNVAVYDLLLECRDLIAPHANAKGVGIELCETNAHIAVDRMRCKQVVLNLLSNAVNYNHSGGKVSVNVHRHHDRWCIAISDTGPGIQPKDMERIFQPFERLGREYLDDEGLGIGLALSRRLAELMDGRLEVTSESGRGATFSAIFPAGGHRGRATLHNAGRASSPIKPVVNQYWRILYAEDHPANYQVVATYLNHLYHYDINQARTNAETWQQLQSATYDLLLLDVRLYSENGLDLLQQLRQDKHLRGLPVIVLSADASEETRQRALANGAQAYLTKPLDLQQLHQTILHTLNQGLATANASRLKVIQ